MNEYSSFETWLNKHLEGAIPAEVAAFNFNLYEEDSDTDFDVQLIGSPEYDPEDPDWACNEVFSTEEDLCHLTAEDWEDCLNKASDYVGTYLRTGKYCGKLTSAQAVTVGFVDGDLEVIYNKEEEK